MFVNENDDESSDDDDEYEQELALENNRNKENKYIPFMGITNCFQNFSVNQKKAHQMHPKSKRPADRIRGIQAFQRVYFLKNRINPNNPKQACPCQRHQHGHNRIPHPT